MHTSQERRSDRFYAETYDATVPDWPDEMGFYQEMAADASRIGGRILELGCGTGRVAIRLAHLGVGVVGLDLSPEMLEIARKKSSRLANVRWVEGDMRSFQLDEAFGLVIIPGHAFQTLTTPDDQLACLGCIRRHLQPKARLVVHVDHQDAAWLGGLAGPNEERYEPRGEFLHPATGKRIRTYRSWSYERSTQTAICRSRWEETDADGQVVDTWHKGPTRIHCIFPFEMEHLLGRAGFAVEAVYGDFARHPLDHQSPDMIWVAQATSPAP